MFEITKEIYWDIRVRQTDRSLYRNPSFRRAYIEARRKRGYSIPEAIEYSKIRIEKERNRELKEDFEKRKFGRVLDNLFRVRSKVNERD